MAVSDPRSPVWPWREEVAWQGRWIWDRLPDLESPGLVTRPAEDPRSPSWVLMRRRFELAELPERAVARLTSDSRHVMAVNGAVVARGPVRSAPNRLHYDQVDLSGALRVGTNVITAVVRYYGSPTPWWFPARPTRHLGAGGMLLEASLGDTWLVSDDTWKALSCEAWTAAPSPGIGGPPEILDARLLPKGWTDPDFDDSEWPWATILPNNHFGFDGDQHPPGLPYGSLVARPITQLSGTVRRPVNTPPGEIPPGEQRLTLDFGQVVSGTVVMEVDGEPGVEFSLSFGEGLETVAGLGDRSELIRYTSPGGPSRFESFDSIGFRIAHLRVSSSAGVRLTKLEVHERLHPRTTGPSFSCSDELLNRIWEVGRRTLDICSHDAYIDCPTREQRAWVGDAATSSAVDLVSNSNWDLARWNVELTASPRSDGMLPMAAAGDLEFLDFTFIPDFALHWVHALETIRLYTGDRDLVGRLAPAAERVVRWFLDYQGGDGLLDHVAGWVFIDWAAVSTRGRCAALNGLWGRALLDLASIADWLGNTGTANWARHVHQELRGGFESFWDPVRELYVDHITDGSPRTPTSQHAQAAAIVGELVPAERLALLVPHLVESERLVDTYWGDEPIGGPRLREGPPPPHWDVHDRIVKAQPGFRPVVHDALARAGRPDLIAGACRDWSRLLRRCGTSFGETWTAGTSSHAWSSGPTRDLVVHTAGIVPGEPGFATARVVPCLGDLEWIRAVTPSPAGLISVKARPDEVSIDSPVPVIFDPTHLWGGHPRELGPGHHEITPP